MARDEADRGAGPGFTMDLTADERGGRVLRVAGDLDLHNAPALWDALGERLGDRADDVRCDLSGVRSAQPGALALIVERLGVRRAGDPRLFGARDDVARILQLLVRQPEKTGARPERRGGLSRLGDTTWEAILYGQRAAGFAGDLVYGVGRALRRPRSVRWRDVPLLVQRAGVQGLVVAGTVSFLAGLMLAFQMASQLMSFGATEALARIIGVAVTRHLAPFLTAVMVAGRSGSAIAAELGTMQVSHEVDGLRVLGLDPMRFLVFPRVLALMVIVPLLTAYANLTGIVGGMVVGAWRLDVPAIEFLYTLRATLDIEDVVRGLLKAWIFGVVIALIACQRGLETRGGSQEVGRAATSAVVAILFMIVLLEAAFAAIGFTFGG